MRSKAKESRTVDELVAEGMREIVALEAARYLRDSATTKDETMKRTTQSAEHSLTSEDARIMRRIKSGRLESSYRRGDRIDARAMLAIEVDKERRYRDDPAEFKRNPGTPADRVELWGDQALRLEIEAGDGEPLL